MIATYVPAVDPRVAAVESLQIMEQQLVGYFEYPTGSKEPTPTDFAFYVAYGEVEATRQKLIACGIAEGWLYATPFGYDTEPWDGEWPDG